MVFLDKDFFWCLNLLEVNGPLRKTTSYLKKGRVSEKQNQIVLRKVYRRLIYVSVDLSWWKASQGKKSVKRMPSITILGHPMKKLVPTETLKRLKQLPTRTQNFAFNLNIETKSTLVTGERELRQRFFCLYIGIRNYQY